MSAFFEKIRRSLERDRALPLAERVRKGLRYLAASAAAPIALRSLSSLGDRARTVGLPAVEGGERISAGDDLTLDCTYAPVELAAGPQGRIEIGDSVSINFGASIRSDASVRIGDRCSIGPYCVVSDSETGTAADARAIEIGAGVWLAGRVTVVAGARIGEGAVIAAGSVVQGEIPARVVAGGIPARILRRLDGDEQSSEPQAARPPVPQPERAPQLRGLVISDFTANDLGSALRLDADEPAVEAAVAPFGQVAQSLLSPPAGAGTDFCVVWTRPESAAPSFSRLLDGEAVDDATLLAEVDAFAALLKQGLRRYRFSFVPTWSVPHWHRGLGMIDARAGGVSRALAAMNVRLMDALGGEASIFVLDAQRWLLAAGNAFDARLWHLGKVPFAPAVFAEAARDVKAALRGALGQARKLVVVDLDDTLWGGIVGDAGWEGLRLGGHDSIGEAHADFQRALKALTRRGIVLGIASKNEESVALEAIEKHPEMALRKADFVGWKIDWRDKAANIAALAQQLNLGLQSVVFLDDNPVERARVREALPEVLVPELPDDKLLWPSALLALRCFDAPALSREDAGRTRMYASEREREALKQAVGSLDEWLKDLGVKIRADRVGPHNLGRTVQLLNKTNQMNLTTRRLSEAELIAWANDSRHDVYALTVSDKFGDAGLTGIVSLEVEGDRGRIVDFVLSCRVMGRKVEQAMLHLAVQRARERGLSLLEAEVKPTSKNKPCQEFWSAVSGFEPIGPLLFKWDAARDYPAPEAVVVERSA